MTKNEKIVALLIVGLAALAWFLLRRQGISLSTSASLNLGRARDDSQALEDREHTDPVGRAEVPSDVWQETTPVYQSYNFPQGVFTSASPSQSYYTAAQVEFDLAPQTSDELGNLSSVGLPASTWIQ